MLALVTLVIIVEFKLTSSTPDKIRTNKLINKKARKQKKRCMRRYNQEAHPSTTDCPSWMGLCGVMSPTARPQEGHVPHQSTSRGRCTEAPLRERPSHSVACCSLRNLYSLPPFPSGSAQFPCFSLKGDREQLSPTSVKQLFQVWTTIIKHPLHTSLALSSGTLKSLDNGWRSQGDGCCST